MYYVNSLTRVERAHDRGAPREALDWLRHGGNGQLFGLGLLAGETDQEGLAAAFLDSCTPRHTFRGKVGYRCITLALPCELAVVAASRPDIARDLLVAAASAALDRVHPGHYYCGVGSIRTRGADGHPRIHALVGKFAVDKATGRVACVTRPHGGSRGRQLWDLKAAWTESVDREFLARLGVRRHPERAISPPRERRCTT